MPLLTNVKPYISDPPLTSQRLLFVTKDGPIPYTFPPCQTTSPPLMMRAFSRETEPETLPKVIKPPGATVSKPVFNSPLVQLNVPVTVLVPSRDRKRSGM